MSRVFSIGIAVGLFTLAFWAYKKNEQDIEEKKQSALIFKDQLKKEQVVQLVLNRVDGVVFELVQKEKEWSVVRPVKDKASSQKVDELLNNILTQTTESIDISSNNWAEYHLDPPFSILSLKDRNNKTWRVGVSGEPNFDQRYFLKKEEQLLLGASQWKTLSQLQADDYLSKRLISSKQVRRPLKISFQTLSYNYVFHFKNQKWQWEKLKLFPLLSASVEKFLDILTQEVIQDFSLEKKSTVSSKWDAPDLKLIVENQKEQKKEIWELKLKKLKSGGSQVIVSDRDFIYGLDSHRTNQLLNFDFRDHKAPFYWDSEKLSQIEVTSSDLNFVLRKSKGEDQEELTWKVIQPKDRQVHSQSLMHFLNWLENLKALSYPSKKEFKGKPVRIVLKSDEDKVLLDLDIRVQKDKVYVQVGSQVMTLSFDLFQKAFQPSILEKKS